MRRLLALTTALLFLELLFFGLLSPLLPGLKREFDLSTAAVGVLMASYALGAIVGAALALVLCTRNGPRTAAVASLVAFAASSAAFGFAPTYAALLGARFLQGVAGATCWTAGLVWLLEVGPVGRRGELLGYAFGVAEAGAILGPALGGVAAAAGRAAAFGGVAIACLALALLTLRMPPPEPISLVGSRVRAMLSSSSVWTTIWLTALPATLLAALSVLAPLQQHAIGAGAGEIAATFAVAALAGVLIRPLFGRWSDRRGPLRPIRIALLCLFPVVLALPWVDSRIFVALMICWSLVLIGVMWAPLVVMFSDACLAAGVGQIMAVTVMNFTWPPGNVLGSAGGAAVAQAAGQRAAYALMATALLCGYLVLRRGVPYEASSVTDRIAEETPGPIIEPGGAYRAS